MTGIYNIYSQQFGEQFEEDADDLCLLLCVNGDEIWGGFQLAHKFDVIHIDRIAADLQMSFGWRARDEYEGLSFGRGCYGEIELFGTDQVRVTFFGMFPEPVSFAGRRRLGPLWCGRSVYSFQQEWSGFPEEAYGR